MVIPIKKSQSGLYNRGVQATIYKKESDFFVQQSKCIGTYEMDVQDHIVFTPKLSIEEKLYIINIEKI